MALEGNDPRTWDLRQLCAAFEFQVRTGCKDEAEWARERSKLYMPPKGAVSSPVGRPVAAPLGAGDVSAFLAAVSAEDKTYGTL
jgi:hypothetical protein